MALIGPFPLPSRDMKYPALFSKQLALLTLSALLAAGCATTPSEPAFVPTKPQPNPPPSQQWPVTTTAQPPGPRPNPAIVPVPQQAAPNSNYQRVHQQFVAQAQKGDIDLLFVGDSITDFWIGASSNGRGGRGKEVWDHYYGNLKAADFGYSADRTQHVLWRLQNGEGQGFSPKVVVLMIGTNNTGIVSRRPQDFPSAWRNTNAETIEGITAVVNELRKDFPQAKIILLSIFPRGDDAIAMQQIPEINRAIAKLDDQKQVFYLDVTKNFLGPDGQINPDYFRLSDRLHPTPAGYVVWAEAMKPLLKKLMQ